MNYRNSKCRFLEEYANFKMSYYNENAKDDYFDKEYAKQSKIRIRNIVRNARKGLITVDEAMMCISKI